MTFGVGLNFGDGAEGGSVIVLSSPATLQIFKSSDLLASVAVAIPAGWSELFWTVKDGREVDKSLDEGSLIQIKLTNGGDAGDGLVVLNREAADDASLGSLTVNDDRTAVTISLSAAAIAEINWVRNKGLHDFAVHTSSGGKPMLVPPGVVTFLTNVTRTLPA